MANKPNQTTRMSFSPYIAITYGTASAYLLGLIMCIARSPRRMGAEAIDVEGRRCGVAISGLLQHFSGMNRNLISRTLNTLMDAGFVKRISYRRGYGYHPIMDCNKKVYALTEALYQKHAAPRYVHRSCVYQLAVNWPYRLSLVGLVYEKITRGARPVSGAGDNHSWSYYSYDDWCLIFSWVSRSTMRRTLKLMIDEGVLLAEQKHLQQVGSRYYQKNQILWLRIP